MVALLVGGVATVDDAQKRFKNFRWLPRVEARDGGLGWVVDLERHRSGTEEKESSGKRCKRVLDM